MEPITVAQLSKVLGGNLASQELVTGICTDSREAGPGSLFVAIPGERVDGHDYVATALAKGAPLALVQRDGGYPAGKTLLVPDTVAAMLTLAAWYRTTKKLHLVAITGSVGKTTTKEMIAAVLSAQFRTIKTIGNQNNEIGMPRTLLSIGDDTQVAVVEMGMCGFGEIAALAKAAQPELGVITNVGVTHLEQLGSRANILKAKLELAEALPDGARLFLCADSDLLEQVTIPRLDVVYYGLESPKATLRGTITGGDNSHMEFRIDWQGQQWRAAIPGAGRHLVQNALAAFGVGVWLGMEPETVIAALGDYQPTGMRQHIVEKNGITFVEDCYNASPDSMAAALATLADFSCTGKRYALLSDMLELGSVAKEAHYHCGELAAQSKLDGLLLWGEYAETIAAGARDAGFFAVEVLPHKAELAPRLKKLLAAGDVVWVKASHGQKLEDVLEALYALL